MPENKPKKVLYSAIQPSGNITLGNYLGALKNWPQMQDDYFCIFALADLHTITVRQEPQNFKKNVLEAYALLLACGIDLNKSTFFIQSHVPAHAELAWVLNCYTQFGELSRMTQFKDKSQKHADNINAGLFTYPSLMAADILLYNSDLVPVGSDQKQHIELTRNIAQRFNQIHGNVFKIPQEHILKNGSKIMSLQDPQKKMSKSDENKNACVLLLDSKEVIFKKFSRAVTDSESIVRKNPGKDGINNLMQIYSCLTGATSQQIETEFLNKGYGEFKTAVAESVWACLEPIQAKFKDLITQKSYLEEKYRENASKAGVLANKCLQKVKKKVGFLE